nr:hypothetical protein BaRGS_006889 [Batillaria attramentaria]
MCGGDVKINTSMNRLHGVFCALYIRDAASDAENDDKFETLAAKSECCQKIMAITVGFFDSQSVTGNGVSRLDKRDCVVGQ